MNINVPLFSILVLIFIAVPTSAQEVPQVEVFGGYSYLNVDVNALGPRQSANGWDASASGNVNGRFAVEGDVSGYYRSLLGVSIRDYSLTGGPRVNFRPVFVHALFGGDRLSGSIAGITDSQWAFAMAVGGGVQFPVSRHLAIRGSGDYVLSRHNIFGGDRLTQNNFRASVGVVFNFGSRDYRERADRKDEEVYSPCTGESETEVLGLKGCSVEQGVKVSSVKAGSIGQKAGVAATDIIIAIDGRPVHTAREIELAIAANTTGIVKISYMIRGAWLTEREVSIHAN